jgi:hypothetical protein
MELTFASGQSAASLLARFTPRGHIQAPPLQRITVSNGGIAFVTSLSGVDYRFVGKRRGSTWSGIIEGLQQKDGIGQWSLTKLKPLERPSSASLPLPTGKNPVGRREFHWTDRSRAELETQNPDDRRQLMVYLFYPARQKPKRGYASYMPDVEAMKGEWTDDYIVRLHKVETHTFQDAPVAGVTARFPLLIFAPGGGQKALSYTSLLEDLASHGYVVAAIDPPYNAPAVRFPDGTVLRKLPPADRGWERPQSRDDMPRIYEQMVIHWANDMRFVLDQLTALNAEIGPFANCIDLKRVGAFGHSRGGQAAGKVRLLDSRFKAGLNLDGNIRGRPFPLDLKMGAGDQPFLWLEKQLPEPTEKDLEDMGLSRTQFEDMWANGNRLLRSIGTTSVRVVVARPGIDHLDFGDTAVLNPALSTDVRAGKERTIQIARAVMREFFDVHLGGKRRQDLSALAKQYPEIAFQSFYAHGSTNSTH